MDMFALSLKVLDHFVKYTSKVKHDKRLSAAVRGSLLYDVAGTTYKDKALSSETGFVNYLRVIWE